jgi:hypothetical protein
MAKPDRPEVSPPKNAAVRKRLKFKASIAVAPDKDGCGAWMDVI